MHYAGDECIPHEASLIEKLLAGQEDSTPLMALAATAGPDPSSSLRPGAVLNQGF